MVRKCGDIKRERLTEFEQTGPQTVEFNLPQFNSEGHVELKQARDKVEQKFKSSKGSVVLTAFLGMGGVGKTELAKALIHSPQAKYQLRAWFHADSASLLLQSYRNFLVHIKASSREAADKLEDETLVQEVNQQLSRFESFLVVVDNADDPSSVMNLLPRVVGDERGGLKHVIITSRSKEWGQLTSSMVMVDVPDREEAVRMFESHSARGNVLGAEREARVELVETVGRLPLAVSQLGAYARVNEHVSLAELLKQWQKNAELAMKWTDLGSSSKSVRVTLITMLQSIGEKPHSELAKHVLNACSVLDPDRIPLSLLQRLLRKLIDQQAKEEQTGDPEEKVNGSLKLLVSHNLLSFDSSQRVYSVHRLVQKAVQLHAGVSQIEADLPLLIDSLFDEFQSEEGGPLAEETRQVGYVPHLDSLMALPFESIPSASASTSVQSREEIKQPSTNTSQQNSQPRLPAIGRAHVLNMNAWVFHDIWRNASEAKPLYEEALPIYESLSLNEFQLC